MTKQSKIVAGVLAGVAVGAAVGLLLYTDRNNGINERISNLFSNLMLTGKDKISDLADKVRTQVSGVAAALPNHASKA